MFAKLSVFLTKRNIVIGIFIVAVVGFLIYRSVSSGGPTQNLVTVTRGDITQEVIVTGNVKPVSNIDLAFEKSGRVIGVNATVGDKVYAGETLVKLDSSELTAQLAQAQANVEAEQATLDSLRVSAAERTLANDYNSVPTTLNDAYSKADDAVRNQVDQFLSNPYISSSVVTDLQTSRVIMGTELVSWKAALDGLSASSPTDTLNKAIADAQIHLQSAAGFLDEAMNAVVGSTVPYTSYKTAISTGRTELSTALANVNSMANTIASHEILAGQNPDNVRAQAAGLAQAQASAALIQAQLSKTALRSPISGTVTVQNAKVGEIAAANTTVTSVISSDRLQIEVNVTEIDVAKVKIGDPATFTLDTYGNNIIFEAKVVSVDPAETVVEGVATYKTKLKIVKEDERIKPGMTANLTITTDKHENVFAIPQRSTFTRNGKTFVLISTGKNTVEREVQTGLRGADGNVEIIGGLNEGDKIVAIPATQ